MPLFEGLSVGVEKTAAIFDIGAAYTKVGFAGETSPRATIPSKIKLSKTDKIVHIWDFTNTEELYDALVEFLHHIYFRHLLVNPRDRRVVVCESVLCPTQFRQTLAKVFFKRYEVPSILFAPSHLTTLFTLGINTALVLDAGYNETTVLPIYEGYPIIKAVESLPLGGKAIHENLERQLKETGTIRENGEEHKPLSSVMDSIPADVLEDIKVRTCFMTNMERATSIQQSILQGDDSKWPSPAASVEYPLNGGRTLTIDGKTREIACEVLFEMDSDEQSIATLVLDSILKCPIDMRKPLADNLVFIGGTSLLPGFSHRLLAELKQLLTKPKYKDCLAISTFKVHSPPAQANFTAWLGGAIFGGLEVLSYRSLTRDVFLQTEVVPDWCSLLPAVTEVEQSAAKDKTPLKSLGLRKPHGEAKGTPEK
ncbi:actin-related protein 10-like [Lytechinus variegatus]|uniref:actin-related protein 10-like n=1 Tax=Lytechinus variegatus TaxID=7654 RepID=UPI001BB14A76|nr:actin-related protein 10-like [Lytechinus variegatus]